ncbi:MAG: hypothetical protein A3F31_03775 [Candidatus Levybacteria bacterium RIFCSPHIGHO2_12_FULL_38_12]|nr:MAG: hypothetical protein A2770_02170 [Candidatus Levybacteria bacterium RIFCSPHIGHO2_01_FULL_38_12]OGH21884.1 MAG: hypothetical protein A3D75_00390 [Candidatus Levybacteria bacterium RIFCSPHIGHO2_02_FULL_37_18]OGH22816.1 MAG: hypothetical protein A3F31_03775 [Candidatus Levybacteria bacterium RIFCSPHIGHO2_12_FULL_38_12]OGH33541.1 MAG: hypothetical protein A3A47_01735 [Candidatus Levybacteria bacterium RIFCSPLOWO2_01_FULL_37_20]OGH44462.1 MAG: hypothetical protein A3J14_03425 [Candidatus Lev
MRRFLFLLFLLFCEVVIGSKVLAQTSTPSPVPTSSSSVCTSIPECASQNLTCDQCVSHFKDKVNSAQSTGKTLASQISAMNNQIKLTEVRVSATKQQLVDLTSNIETTTKKISKLEESLDSLTKILANRIVVSYEVGSGNELQTLFLASNFSDLISRAQYLRIVQSHDRKLIFQTQQAKNDYANQKTIFEDRKKKVEDLKTQLEAYNTQLDTEKKSKQELLAVTRNDEERYQKLLSDALAQTQAFKSFSKSQGGTILPPQPSPDGWYFNQRDERWARNNIGRSGEQIWDVGCLVASTAMVLKKHGQSVTPSDVAGNASYFFSDTAYMLLPWNGGKFASIWGYDGGSIDNKLASGEPVLVGLRAGVYGMHFVVLKSGSGGNYTMNDPWNGPDLKFSDYYSTGQIFQWGYYNG